MVKSFLVLLKALKERPISFILVFVICAASYVLYEQTEVIFDKVTPPHRASFQDTLATDQKVGTALVNFAADTGADMVFISQFHNGQYDLTRIPFTKVTVTYAIGNGSESRDIYQPRPISSENALMYRMWANVQKPVCIQAPVQQIADSYYRNQAINSGWAYVSLCPLTNILDYPIGYVGAGFKKEPSIVDVSLQRTLAVKIAGSLQEGVK